MLEYRTKDLRFTLDMETLSWGVIAGFGVVIDTVAIENDIAADKDVVNATAVLTSEASDGDTLDLLDYGSSVSNLAMALNNSAVKFLQEAQEIIDASGE